MANLEVESRKRLRRKQEERDKDFLICKIKDLTARIQSGIGREEDYEDLGEFLERGKGLGEENEKYYRRALKLYQNYVTGKSEFV